jgi:hypothetical protein
VTPICQFDGRVPKPLRIGASTEHHHARAELDIRYAAATLHHRWNEHHQARIAFGVGSDCTSSLSSVR